MKTDAPYEQVMSCAASLAEAGDHCGATAAYHEAIALARDRPDAHYELGLLHYRAGEAREATTCLKKAARLQPEDATVWNKLAVAHYACGEWERSVQAFREALARQRSYAEAWYGLARALLEQNRGRDAARALFTCLRWEPQHGRAQAALDALPIERIIAPVECEDEASADRLPKGLAPRSPQAELALVAGVGHCGTAWLAKALDRPSEGMVFHHELKARVTGLLLKETMQLEFDRTGDELDRLYSKYYAFVRGQLRRLQVMGDSHSWTPYMIPEVASRIPISGIIYLVRNGIQNVHSHFQTKHDFPRDHFLYADFLCRYWRMLGRPEGEWEAYTKWECNCFWWQLNQTMPGWLADQLGNDKVLVYRLENLSQDADLLTDLISKLHPDSGVTHQEATLVQKMDVNRHIRGDRRPEALWARWTDAQRGAFERICGDTMAQYGYSIPDGHGRAGVPQLVALGKQSE